MTDMSNMVMMGGNSSMAMSGLANGDNNNSSNNMSSMNTSSTMMNMVSKINKNYSLVNMTDFQSAQVLATRASGIFDTELRLMVPKNESNFANNLEGGLTQLNDLVRNKASPMDIMMVVHSQIHPNLLEAFNLQLR
jgi:ABC-type transport system involved in Fe-S cluster assembly fused permease/ATPase subunit